MFENERAMPRRMRNVERGFKKSHKWRSLWVKEYAPGNPDFLASVSNQTAIAPFKSIERVGVA